MAKVQAYKVSKEINGVTYTAQFIGASAALRATDECKNEYGVVMSEKLSDYILKHVIVEPTGLTTDDFASLDEANEVTNFGSDVMTGKLKPETEEKAKK